MNNWILYLFALGGLALHILKRVTGNRLHLVDDYIKENDLTILLSFMATTLLFWAWVYQPDLLAAWGFPYQPGRLSSLALGFLADSGFAFLSDRAKTK